MAGCITARSGSQLRTEYFGFLLTAFLSFFVASASAEIHEVYPGYLVRARSAAATTDGVAAAANARNRFRARGMRADALDVREEVFLVRSDDAIDLASDEITESISDEEIAARCKTLKEELDLSFCEPNYKLSALATPNDSQYSSLWGMKGNYGVSAPQAWDLSTGSSDTIVAVVDTGIDYKHVDLAANMWVNPLEIANNNIDDDGNGYIDDVHGINAITGSGNPMDDHGHGTHVAGTIGALGNNGLGVVGVNWQAKIIGVKFLSSSGSGSLANAVKGLNYLVKLTTKYNVKIRLSNNSWGGGGYSQALHDAISTLNNAGILFVAASGNEGDDNDADPHYPSGYDLPNVISVAAVDQNGNLANFSNYGQFSVDVAAPGVNILSTIPGNKYATFSGTSMATPHVSGVLALLASYDPTLSASALKTRLLESGTSLASLGGVTYSSRLVSAHRALANLTAPVADPGNVQDFNYGITKIPFTTNTAVENEAIFQQADELNYKDIELPFTFPFYGKSTTNLIVSPNGVLYLGAAPSSMDYQSGKKAPKNAIAVAHADLFANKSPYGVRVHVEADRATVMWRVKLYGSQNGADLKAYAVLYPSGVVELSYKTTAPILSYLNSHAVVGLAGSFAAHTDTFHGTLTNDTIRFQPVGETAPFAFSLSSPKKAFKKGPNPVIVTGDPNSAVDLAVDLNNLRCDLGQYPGAGQVNVNLPVLGVKGTLTFRLLQGQVVQDSLKRAYNPPKKGAVKSAAKLQKIGIKKATKICTKIQQAMGM